MFLVTCVISVGRKAARVSVLMRMRSRYKLLLPPIYMLQMADKTTLFVNGVELVYAREKGGRIARFARVSTVLFFVGVLLLSVLLFLLQISGNRVLEELARYARIKKNLASWQPLVASKSRLESERGRYYRLRNPALGNFLCVDFGAFYLPARLAEATALPEAVRRGRGDGWMIKKAAPKDEGARQFCEYVVAAGASSTVTCGLDMFRELGYSGYFEAGHWCGEFLKRVGDEKP
ncbi:IMV membrane protein [Nile crocodilepox virus]|uniref:IMV membrane protein n=1 Tax=Nile crocodilepox virus (isolate Crocodylus niloticus/Zimbabwe/Ume/2001) TaxID=1289473 RepID=Q070E9_CPRVZ|nr:IMV membrane protein [Nile crocodilepox virus]ABJ08992.1 IMV membrane protein [Nile crocodilepox virus]